MVSLPESISVEVSQPTVVEDDKAPVVHFRGEQRLPAH